MDTKEILERVDHTLLKQDATWEQMRTLCDEALQYGCASVCVPPSYVLRCNDYVGDKLRVCTVIGFPNGYNTTAVKVFETENAIQNGADEIDMVINIGWVKSGLWDKVLNEIKSVKAACKGRILKVIIECCLMTEEEKIKLCQIVSDSGADFIKTSTGFAGGGATREDVALLRKTVAPHVKVKAAGGIADLKDAEEFLELGADRLGTSKVVKAVKEGQG
jgi:deoxyribose-phosphate aldolase